MTSGGTAQMVKGRLNGPEMDEHAKTLNKPPNYFMPFPLVWEYLSASYKWDKAGVPTVLDEFFTSVDASTLEQALPANFTKQPVPHLLRGLWCGPTHPSDLACFIPYASEKEHLPGKSGIPSQGFVPGYVFFWDSPGARNTLEFFTRHNLEFGFPKWAKDLTNTTASGIWTSARRPFSMIPYPVAVYEGFPPDPLQLYRMRKLTGDKFWDPAKSKDPALCFCSAHFDGDRVIVRNNFGSETYRVYKVIDENGKKTEYWPQLQSWASGRRLVSLKIPLQPDRTCVGNCFWWTLGRFILFYIPVVLLLCCCCCIIPACCFVLCCHKNLKGTKTKGTDEDEELEDADDYSDEAPLVE